MDDKFLLEPISIVNANLAEYNMLTSLYNEFSDSIFILEIENLSLIKNYFTDIIAYVSKNYKSFDFRNFKFDKFGNLSHQILCNKAGSSLQKSSVFNQGRKISSKNKDYVLVKSVDSFLLFSNGELDEHFNHQFTDRKKLEELDKMKRGIDDLEWVFEEYQIKRKYNPSRYIVNDKISNDITEQELRNDLIAFLIEKTNLYITSELCTSRIHDEESVDIGIVDVNNRTAIIEVKYFVKKGMFEDESKSSVYSINRFKDGYEQLDRYCAHLNEDNYCLHSAYLYMFYAHTDSITDIKKKASKILEEYKISIEHNSSSLKFLHHYKNTIIDNMLNSKRPALV